MFISSRARKTENWWMYFSPERGQRAEYKNENITEENQTRVFPEGLILRGQRGAVAEPAPEKPGCIWRGQPGGNRRERDRIYWEKHHGSSATRLGRRNSAVLS